MRTLSNPWTKFEDFNCFGCSPNNTIGLKMNFVEEQEYITCEWEPGIQYQGYHNILHGGIQATLMDEIASWTVFVKAGKGGVTSRLEIKYRKPVSIKGGAIRLRAKILEENNRMARVQVELFNSDRLLCTEGVVDCFVLSSGRSDAGIMFPGKDAFYEK